MIAKVIFLDIDGVLNDHVPRDNGYCGMQMEFVHELNRILAAVPDAQLVISSAWRYMVIRGEMTLKGFEFLLVSHGVNCLGRVHGVTDPDDDVPPEKHEPPFDKAWWSAFGMEQRPKQIHRYVAAHGIDRYVILEDLPLFCDNHIYTVSGEFGRQVLGLKSWDANNAISILNPPPPEDQKKVVDLMDALKKSLEESKKKVKL